MLFCLSPSLIHTPTHILFSSYWTCILSFFLLSLSSIYIIFSLFCITLEAEQLWWYQINLDKYIWCLEIAFIRLFIILCFQKLGPTDGEKKRPKEGWERKQLGTSMLKKSVFRRGQSFSCGGHGAISWLVLGTTVWRPPDLWRHRNLNVTLLLHFDDFWCRYVYNELTKIKKSFDISCLSIS